MDMLLRVQACKDSFGRLLFTVQSIGVSKSRPDCREAKGSRATGQDSTIKAVFYPRSALGLLSEAEWGFFTAESGTWGSPSRDVDQLAARHRSAVSLDY